MYTWHTCFNYKNVLSLSATQTPQRTTHPLQEPQMTEKYPKAFLKSLNSFLLALAQPLFQPNSKLLALPPTSRPQSATGSPRALQPTAPEPPQAYPPVGQHQAQTTEPWSQLSWDLAHLSAVWQQP